MYYFKKCSMTRNETDKRHVYKMINTKCELTKQTQPKVVLALLLENRNYMPLSIYKKKAAAAARRPAAPTETRLAAPVKGWTVAVAEADGEVPLTELELVALT